MEGYQFAVVYLKETGRYVINFAKKKSENDKGEDDGKCVLIDLCSFIVLIEDVDHFWVLWFCAPPETDPVQFQLNPTKFKQLCHTFNGVKTDADKDDVLYDLYQDLLIEAKYPKKKLKLLFNFGDLHECLIDELKLNQQSAQHVLDYMQKNKSN